MKTLKLITLSLSLLLVLGIGAKAQTAQKLGFVDGEAIVYSLPEIQSVQQTMQKFQQDSIGAEYERISKEFNDKDSLYRNPATSASVKKTLETELQQLRTQLINWQQEAEQRIQQKQGELLSPLYKRVGDAINAYAKEKAYTHVFNRGTALVFPPADDITIEVAKRLGIKVNENATPGGTTPPTPAGGN